MKRVICATVTVLAAIVLFTALPLNSTAPTPPEPFIPLPMVLFSHPAGFYDEAIELTLTSNYDDAVIFYTTDGTPPITDGTCETTELYAGPITVYDPQLWTNRHETKIFSINAVAVTEDLTGEPYTRNFVTGELVHERFGEEFLVFALNSDPHGLYDHFDGIFVEGIDREKWREQTGSNGTPPDPANFNRRGRESERAVHVQVFDNKGNVLVSQNAGMRVKGGWSRAAPQKSLELYARNSYSGTNVFNFAFFGEREVRELSDAPITKYRRIRLRNGGNDRDFATVRDELSATLFRQAGFPDTQSHTPCAIFLNGEYYGFSWLKSPRTPDHWQRRYGGKADRFELIEGGEGEQRENPEDWGGEPRAVEDWCDIVTTLVRKGLTDKTRWTEFCKRVDVDNAILYYALQIYINNNDWPGGNIEMWRYFPKEGETDLHPYLADGRWRFIAYDIEFAWNLYGRDMVSHNNIHSVLTGDGQMGGKSEILEALLERKDMRKRFADTLVQLMEGAFAPDNVIQVLEELTQLNQAEVDMSIYANLYAPDNEHWPTRWSMADSQRDIRTFALQRPKYVQQFIYDTLGLVVDVDYLEFEPGG
ncbi:MAG: CotH kinase family protein [Oscillospiraceae bacterium]|nr:CotH kinase family protein [Oscillospiraceae bacterium]